MIGNRATGVATGLEHFLAEGVSELAGARVGLVTNHTGIDRHFRSGADLLNDSNRIQLVALFGPEHGIRGEAQAGVGVEQSIDPRSRLPVYSLYGAAKRPSRAMLEGIDALIFDIQDVGARYATYISTMVYAQEAAVEAGIRFVVLDRPNPLGGKYVEGKLLNPRFASFVGAHSLPVRHGMTVGEIATLFAAERGLPTPQVVPMQGWRRSMWFDQAGLPWVQPSPNLPTLASTTLYPGTCLLEGTNISEGRGTTRPFELIGAPWIDPFRLALELEGRALPGVAFRPTFFTPTFSKHAHVSCAGLQIHILDREVLRPVALGVHLLHALRAHAPGSFAWMQREDGVFFVDLLFGGDELRLTLDSGAETEELLEHLADDVELFERRRRPFLRYPEEEDGFESAEHHRKHQPGYEDD